MRYLCRRCGSIRTTRYPCKVCGAPVPETSPSPLEVQVRYNSGKLAFFTTVADAFAAASNDCEIWKISWTVAQTGERIRLVRNPHDQFFYSPIMGS